MPNQIWIHFIASSITLAHSLCAYTHTQTQNTTKEQTKFKVHEQWPKKKQLLNRNFIFYFRIFMPNRSTDKNLYEIICFACFLYFYRCQNESENSFFIIFFGYSLYVFVRVQLTGRVHRPFRHTYRDPICIESEWWKGVTMLLWLCLTTSTQLAIKRSDEKCRKHDTFIQRSCQYQL